MEHKRTSTPGCSNRGPCKTGSGHQMATSATSFVAPRVALQSLERAQKLQPRFEQQLHDRGSVMAQAITSWFICDGRFRVHAINAVGRRRARIIEIEDVETGERVHGSARRLERLFLSLGSSGFGPSSDTLLSRNQTR
jgi:hypothetical protein